MWLTAVGKNLGNLPFRLNPGAYVVGRAHSAEVTIADTTVSRHHARLIRSTSGSLVVEDLESSNGTFVERTRVTQCQLMVGNWVQFGGVGCMISSTPEGWDSAIDEETTLRVQKFNPEVGAAIELTDIEFTAAQQQILDLVLQGHSEPRISELLDRSPHTVHAHLKAIFRRLRVHSRAELIVKLLQRRGKRLPHEH